MSNFTQEQSRDLFDSVRSAAKRLAIFPADVPGYDPVAPPKGRLSCSVSLGPVRPEGQQSGLAAVSCAVTLIVRVWANANQKPLDNLDADTLWAATALMGAFAGGFTLSGTVRNVDLMAMQAHPGYVHFEGSEYRSMDITLPIIIDDMFEEVA